MSLSNREQETIVRFSKDREDLMTVFTHEASKVAALKRAGATLKRVRNIEGEERAWTLEMPRDWFRWPKPRRKLTGAQLERAQASGQRLAARRTKGARKTT